MLIKSHLVKFHRILPKVTTFGELSTWLCLKQQNRPENLLKPELEIQPCSDDGKGIVTIYPGGRTREFNWFV